MLFTLSFSILLIPLLQLLLEMVEVEHPLLSIWRTVQLVSLAWLFPVCRGLFSHKEGAAGKPGGSSPSRALLLLLHLRLAAEKLMLRMPLLQENLRREPVCHYSFLLQSTLFQGKLGLLLTYSVTRACTTPWETLPIWLYSYYH